MAEPQLELSVSNFSIYFFPTTTYSKNNRNSENLHSSEACAKNLTGTTSVNPNNLKTLRFRLQKKKGGIWLTMGKLLILCDSVSYL